MKFACSLERISAYSLLGFKVQSYYALALIVAIRATR